MQDQVDMEATGLRARLRVIIFGTDTRAGRAFDVILLWAILLSVAAVMVETRSANLMELAAGLPRKIGSKDHRYQ